MPDINPSIPVVGQPDSTEEPKIVTALQSIVAAVNDIDAANITDLSVTTADLADGLITSAKLAASAKVSLSTDTSISSQAGTGGWADISSLSIAITPTVAVYYVAILSATVRRGAAGTEQTYLAIDVDGSNAGEATVPVTQSYDETGIVIAAGTLTAAAHTIKGEFNGSASSSLVFSTNSHKLYVVTFPQ